MTGSLYDKLLAVLDAFIDEFGAQIRFRGIQTALLIQKASLDGAGISVSEVQKVTGAPPENIRRHFSRQVERGRLHSYSDSEDDRVVRYQMADPVTHQLVARRLAQRLAAIGPPSETPHAGLRPFNRATYDALIDVLQAYADHMDSGLRIRGIKMAIVIQQASLSGAGITASEIARQSGAPLETVRRYTRSYMDIGHLTAMKHPNDSRASLLFYTDPAGVARLFEAVARRMNRADWSAFNLAD